MAFWGEIRGSYSAVVYGRVVLGYIVGIVGRAEAPEVPEFCLGVSSS